MLGKCPHAFHIVWHFAISWPAGAVSCTNKWYSNKVYNKRMFLYPEVKNGGVQLCSYRLMVHPFFICDLPIFI